MLLKTDWLRVPSWSDRQSTSPPAEEALTIAMPYATLQHRQRGIHRRERLCSGLNASLRIIRVLAIPYSLDLDCPPMHESAARSKIACLESDLQFFSAEKKLGRGLKVAGPLVSMCGEETFRA